MIITRLCYAALGFILWFFGLNFFVAALVAFLAYFVYNTNLPGRSFDEKIKEAREDRHLRHLKLVKMYNHYIEKEIIKIARQGRQFGSLWFPESHRDAVIQAFTEWKSDQNENQSKNVKNIVVLKFERFAGSTVQKEFWPVPWFPFVFFDFEAEDKLSITWNQLDQK